MDDSKEMEDAKQASDKFMRLMRDRYPNVALTMLISEKDVTQVQSHISKPQVMRILIEIISNLIDQGIEADGMHVELRKEHAH